ncbi:hypothetical protein PMIN06_001403 [Paraphaeosphaeria minitans]
MVPAVDPQVQPRLFTPASYPPAGPPGVSPARSALLLSLLSPHHRTARHGPLKSRHQLAPRQHAEPAYCSARSLFLRQLPAPSIQSFHRAPRRQSPTCSAGSQHAAIIKHRRNPNHDRLRPSPLRAS